MKTIYEKPKVEDLKDVCKRMYVKKEGHCKIRIKDNSYDNCIVQKIHCCRFHVVLYI